MGETPRRRYVFGTPLIETEYGDAAFRSALLEVVALRRNSAPGVARSNIGGWHSTPDMALWGGAAAEALAAKTLAVCGAATRDQGLAAGAAARYLFEAEMWANVSPAGAANEAHAHPGSFWSAVYFLDDGGDPAGGALALLDPRFPMARMHAPELAILDADDAPEESTVIIRPRPGLLIAFPSWLMHLVRPHQGPGERVSIALNVIARPVRTG